VVKAFGVHTSIALTAIASIGGLLTLIIIRWDPARLDVDLDDPDLPGVATTGTSASAALLARQSCP
jgi:hypothetical protein